MHKWWKINVWCDWNYRQNWDFWHKLRRLAEKSRVTQSILRLRKHCLPNTCQTMRQRSEQHSITGVATVNQFVSIVSLPKLRMRWQFGFPSVRTMSSKQRHTLRTRWVSWPATDMKMLSRKLGIFWVLHALDLCELKPNHPNLEKSNYTSEKNSLLQVFRIRLDSCVLPMWHLAALNDCQKSCRTGSHAGLDINNASAVSTYRSDYRGEISSVVDTTKIGTSFVLCVRHPLLVQRHWLFDIPKMRPLLI